METKVFPAFGHTILRRTCVKNEVISDEDYTDGVINIVEPWPTSWLITKGLIHQIHLESGNVSVRGPGYNTIDNPEPSGLSRCVFVEDATVFCVPDNSSRGLSQKLKPFVLKAGASKTLVQGTKLAVFQGVLSVDGKSIRDMRQVEVKTADKTATAVEDVYGFIFP